MTNTNTLREKLVAGMIRGKWYFVGELAKMTGSNAAAVGTLLARMRNAGRVATQQPVGAGSGPRRYRLMEKVDGGLKRNAGHTGHKQRRELFPVEKLPIGKVREHVAMVAQDEVWRGKTWEDMPGAEDFIRKCNFFFWRRGMLKYGSYMGVAKPGLVKRGFC